MRKLRHIIVAGVMAVVLSACGANLAGEPEIVASIPPPPTETVSASVSDLGYPATAPDLLQGARVYMQYNCAACHGADGAGVRQELGDGEILQPPSLLERENVASDTPADYFDIITNGNIENLMPPWAEQIDEQGRWAVALHNYTLRYAQGDIERGETLFTDHFADFDAFDLTDTRAMAEVSDQQLYDALSETSPETLSEDDLWQTVAYARTRSLASVDAIGRSAEALLEPISADIVGQITSGTLGGEVPSDGPVNLLILRESEQGIELVDEMETTITDGEFVFEDMTVDPALTYVAVTVYRDRQFISEPQPGSAPLTDGNLTLPIEVYEFTEDPEVISIERMVVQISVEETGLRVAQVATFRNDSDRLFTSSQALNAEGTQFGSTVMFLPPGAVVAGFSGDPQRYIVSEEDFAVIDTQPVLPGDDHVMQVVYILPYDDGAIIEHPVAYDVDGIVRLLVRPQGLDVESEQFTFTGIAEVGGELYAEYGYDDGVSRGAAVRYELGGTLAEAAQRTANDGSGNILPIILFAISGVTGVAAIGLWFYGRTSDPEKQRSREIDSLVAQIAALDDAHDKGTLNHDLWHKQRNELKAELKTLMEAKPTDEQ